MKRVFILFAIPFLLLRLPVAAQDDASTPVPAPAPAPNIAASVAAREDAEDRYKRVAADLQAVQSDNEALHARITALEQEMKAVREAQARPADTSVQDELKRLAEKIQEVDKKRLEDKDVISEEIRKSIGRLESSLGSATATIREPKPKAPKAPVVVDSAALDKAYSYTVQSGDRLDLIVKAYNADFKSKGMKTITLKQTMELNPTVNWSRLRVGQKIVIPRPEGS
jgi:hypothetical protein